MRLRVGLDLPTVLFMTTWSSRLTTRALADDRNAWITTAGLALVCYLMTAHWLTGQVNDSQAAIWPAWQLINAGTFDLSSAAELPDLPWFGEVDGRTVSYRTMGVILSGVPFAALAAPLGLDAEQVGALAAASYTALAVANMHVALRSVVPPAWAALAAGTLALGTPLWTTAAAELWTHGPNAFWLSLALVALLRERLWLAGLAFAPAVMTRPHLALVAAACGLTLAWAGRSVRPALAVGLPASLAIPALVLWNGWYYGTPNIGGAYQGKFAAISSTRGASDAVLFLQDTAGAFLSPATGLLLYSPLVTLLLVLIPVGWRLAPPWARGALLGGVAYQVVQLRLNRYSGGGAFYSNRLVVEFVVLSAPVWVLGLQRWVTAGGLRRRQVAASLAAVGVAVHAFGALNAYDLRGTAGDWWIWYPKVVLGALGLRGYVIALCLAAIPVLAALLVSRYSNTGHSPVPAASPSSEQLVRS